MTLDEARALGTRIGETLANDIKLDTLKFLIVMREQGATPQEIRDFLAWHIDQIKHWRDHDLDGQVRALVQALLDDERVVH